jgi:MSHA pilin protein MshD
MFIECSKRSSRIARRNGAGFTLPELLLLIVVFAIGLAGILVVFNTVVAGSADPMVRKQAMAIAESMVEEVLAQPFAVNGAAPGVKNQTTRASFDDVRDYDGFATSGIYRIEDGTTRIAGLENYNVAVTVTQAAPAGSGVPSTASLLVTVNVTGPHTSYALSGYKLDY